MDPNRSTFTVVENALPETDHTSKVIVATLRALVEAGMLPQQKPALSLRIT